jgi:hypothetical protein
MQVHYTIDMAQKKPFVLRLNPEMLKALERWAEDEFRSVNGQIEYLLQQALKENNRLHRSEPEQTEEGREEKSS